MKPSFYDKMWGTFSRLLIHLKYYQNGGRTKKTFISVMASRLYRVMLLTPSISDINYLFSLDTANY
jgi:hypothetical protein